MIPVEIRFPAPFNRTKVIRREVPVQWNDLTAEQLLAVADALHRIDPDAQGGGRSTDPVALKVHMLRVLLSLNWYRYRQLTEVHVTLLGHLTGFLLQENRLTRNLLPVLRLYRQLTVLHGPADNFRNLRFNEFIYADSYFLHYHQTKDEKSLDTLIAVLYRPKQTDCNPDSETFRGDVRTDFNENLIDRRAARLDKLPKKVKYAILLWYIGCRQHLVASYPNVFSGKKENAQARQPWITMVRHVPSDKFGTISQIESELVHKVLYHLDEMMVEAQEQRKEYERQPGR